MSMFDKKMYIETFSALHAADNTLDQIYQAAAQKRSPNPSRIRHALILAAMLVLMASSAVVAAGGRIMNTSSDSAPAQGNANGTLAEAHWVDSEIGICFAITAGPEELQDHSEESVSNEMQKEPEEVSDKIVENTPDGSSSSKIQNTSGGFSSDKTGATRKELLACAKSVIDHNR